MFLDKIDLKLGNFLINEPFCKPSPLSKIRIFLEEYSPLSSGQYPACTVPGPGGLNVELKTEPLTYSGDSGPPGHMPEAMMGAYTGGPEGYGAYHGGYEEAAARHGGAWPGGVAGAGYHHHHHASLAQGSPTQRYPYYDSRYDAQHKLY